MSTSRPAMSKISGKPVGTVGFGMLGLTKPWAPVEYPAALKVLKTALEQGSNFWNGGIHYGTPTANSLHLIKHYFEQYPEDVDKVCLSIKGAFDMKNGPDGSPEGISASVDYALEVLGGVKTIDVFELARVDPRVPVETSVQTLADLVKEGKVGGIGLSEVSAATIRKEHGVHTIAAVEIELSLFTADPLHNGIVITCHDLGIPVIAYSPISRGWLTGEQAASIDRDFLAIYRSLPGNTLVQSHTAAEDVRRAVLTCFIGRSGNWLIVFDGVDELHKGDKNFVDLP
ncbi:NADP-dependent oxidoreductase domain-containing protein [Coniochaeta sp. 2T2.1]|nr:NADP-dependent oxidoreductase domain-containing protein [Coniochaeta sp. 2T2.1]